MRAANVFGRSQINRDFLVDVSNGLIPGYSLIHKFGRNSAVGNSYEPISPNGIYQTPQPASATTLRVKAGGNTNDKAGGTGAREVSLQGLDETGAVATDTLALDGSTASGATTVTFMRLFRAWVSESGTYATSAAGSHTAAITIENGAGGTDWTTIDATGFAKSQSEIAAYTIPVGYTGVLLGLDVFVDSAQTTDLLFFRRQGIMDASPPYEAMRLIFQAQSKGETVRYVPRGGLQIGTATDLGLLAKTSGGSGEVTADFEILLIDNNYLT